MGRFHFRQIQYHVAYKKVGEEKFHVIKNNSNSWVADPFLLHYKGEMYIFGEMWINLKEKGVIAYSKWDGEKFSRWYPVIEESYHLSYPNVFTYGGEIYICPESNESNEIYLYKAIEFPHRWEKVHVLISAGRYVDTTFFKNDNEIYGLTYKLLEGRKDINGQLCIFRVDNGKAVFLSNNPISEDDSVARPAGKCIKRNNKRIRVSQNCNGVYGKSLVFSEMSFDGVDYKERLLCEIYPKDIVYNEKFNLIGIHTYNEAGNYQVIDLRSYDFSVKLLFWKIINKFRKVIGAV